MKYQQAIAEARTSAATTGQAFVCRNMPVRYHVRQTPSDMVVAAVTVAADGRLVIDGGPPMTQPNPDRGLMRLCRRLVAAEGDDRQAIADELAAWLEAFGPPQTVDGLKGLAKASAANDGRWASVVLSCLADI